MSFPITVYPIPVVKQVIQPKLTTEEKRLLTSALKAIESAEGSWGAIDKLAARFEPNQNSNKKK